MKGYLLELKDFDSARWTHAQQSSQALVCGCSSIAVATGRPLCSVAGSASSTVVETSHAQNCSNLDGSPAMASHRTFSRINTTTATCRFTPFATNNPSPTQHLHRLNDMISGTVLSHPARQTSSARIAYYPPPTASDRTARAPA